MSAPIFFFRLGKAGLGDPDEGRNAEAAREILVTGDWVTPHLDGARYLDKPPAFFWVVAVSYRLFGVGESAARAPSALFALAGIALVYWFARRRLGGRAAWLAALTLALSPLYIIFGRIVIFDMMLTLCMTVSCLAAFEAMEGGRPRAPGALFFIAAGIGTITKGPVALVAPLLVAVAWALLRGRPGLLRRLGWGTGALLYAAVLAPWLILVESRNPGYLHYAIIGENLERMTSNRFETARPFYFYAKVLLPGLFPWILYAGADAARRVRALLPGSAAGGTARRESGAWRAAWARLASETDRDRLVTAFSGAWLGTLVLFFSLIASKRPSYMLPCAVPLALLNGRLWAQALGPRRDPAARGSLATGAWWTAAVCAAGAVAALLAGPAGLARGISRGKYDILLSRPLLFTMTAAGLALAAGLLIATRGRPGALFAASALAIAAVVPLSQAASGYLDMVRSSRPVSRFLERLLKPDDLVVCYEQYRPGVNFYLRRPIDLVTSGTPFSSWYIMRHLEEFRRDPSFRMITLDQLRRHLEAEAPNVYILSPPRMYGLLRRDAGPALDPDPIYEDFGGGLFVRTAGR
ncbi:MAG: glycosyltransferase family 39 protein [Acidobacteria bacterium]|nr:glycosyltransferase family 39 protein [Acidobacteriota bacterium]